MDWLQGFDDAPFAPTYLNELITGPQLSLRERYWIDANPTTTNLFTFLAHSDDIYKRPLYVTLEMMLNGNKVNHLQGGSVVQTWTSFSLSPIEWIMVGQFFLSDNSFNAANKGRVESPAYPEMPKAFFRWRLDLEDQRAATIEMINKPKP